ncbi:MAG: cyanophycinase [Bacteroidetes bacterium]|nr:cyanophycinase [Bacteroidota bacterium]
MACLFIQPIFGQTTNLPEGNLFIIGGGERPDSLMIDLLKTAQLNAKDYIVVLPMSGAEPDTSFFYFKEQMSTLCKNTIANLNFTKEKAHDKTWLDSLRKAKLIFITGGDQSRFMSIVLNTPIYTAIHEAYQKGATISGTSAGAAVMSKFMITGNQLVGDTSYSATFDRIWSNNIEFSQGLGLLDSIIIDQHFIVRSRYNRLLSALYAYPNFTCIGIDESTAIIFHKKRITVAGKSQVLVFSNMEDQKAVKGLIKFSDIHLSIYTSGDSFLCK